MIILGYVFKLEEEGFNAKLLPDKVISEFRYNLMVLRSNFAENGDGINVQVRKRAK
jgi:hypothetical protein